MKRQDYTAEHHALLLGLFGRTLEERYGEYGLDVLANGIIRYGHQRGRRMRERAVRDGRRLDYETFLAYGELRISSGPEDYSCGRAFPLPCRASTAASSVPRAWLLRQKACRHSLSLSVRSACRLSPL